MKFYKSAFIAIFTVIALVLFNACQYQNTGEQMAGAESDVKHIEKAVCELYPAEGYEAEGTVIFTETDSGIHIHVKMMGLTMGDHGFHIHQLGDCTAPDASSAGGHFNPHNTKHGSQTDDVRHVGDLGNIYANETGLVDYEFADTMISFTGENSIIGRSVVVHEGKDDFVSQPSGDAGPRVACGVIGIAY